ncbi:hypothetical protein FO519_004134 [Halicephalobus sp. NKZ332]|nr:hypothetical protein FO519_004134 [Halicephalobus sp. NKZ332]
MSRWRAQSRERTNRYEGQGVQAFTPLPPKNDLNRVQQEKIGQRQVFGGITQVQNGNLRENLQNHIRTRTPEPRNASNLSSHKENMGDKIRREYLKSRRSRSREPAGTRAPGARGRTPQPPSTNMFQKDLRRRSQPPSNTVLQKELGRRRGRGANSESQNYERPVLIFQERSSLDLSSREPSVEPPTRKARKTPARSTSKEPPRKRGRPPKNIQSAKKTPQKSSQRNAENLSIPSFSEERRPTLEQQIIRQPSVALAVQKIYGPKFLDGFPYVPNFLTPEVRNNGEGLPAINYIMNEIFLKSNNLLQG